MKVMHDNDAPILPLRKIHKHEPRVIGKKSDKAVRFSHKNKVVPIQRSFSVFSSISEHSWSGWGDGYNSESSSFSEFSEFSETSSVVTEVSRKTRLKSALKKKKKKSKSSRSGRKNVSKNVDFGLDEFDCPLSTIHYLPTEDYTYSDVWWTEAETDACRRRCQGVIERFRSNEQCVELIEKILEFKNQKNIEKAMKKLKKQFPEACGLETHISQKYQEKLLVHRLFVLDTADEVYRYGLAGSQEGASVIRQCSKDSSKMVQRLAKKFA